MFYYVYVNHITHTMMIVKICWLKTSVQIKAGDLFAFILWCSGLQPNGELRQISKQLRVSKFDHMADDEIYFLKMY